MIQIKRLPPAIQKKQRYLEFQVHSEERVGLSEVVDAVWDSALGFSGSKGASEMDFWIIGNRFDEEQQRGVIRVNRNGEDDLRAALALVKEIDGGEAMIRVTKVSGTLESLD